MSKIIFINLRSHAVERMVPIFEAHKRDLEIVLVTDKAPDLDLTLFSEIIECDTYNIEEAKQIICDYAKDKDIVGIATWADKDVELVASVCEELGLPGISPIAAKRARNKALMRDCLSKDYPYLCPKFKKVYTYEDFHSAVKEIGTPGILKPVGASGSKAIFKIDNKTNLTNVFSEIKQATSVSFDKVYSYYPNEYIYEEYLDGPEVSVEGIVQNGKIYIAGVTDKKVTSDFSLEYMEIFPSEKDKTILDEIKGAAFNVVKCLEFNNCAFHLEGRVVNGKFKVIEIAARPGGGFITSHLLQYAGDVSFLGMVIDMIIGKDISLKWVEFDKCSNFKFSNFDLLSSEEGKLIKFSGIERVLELPEVLLMIPNKHIGEQIIQPPVDFSSCYLATFLLKGTRTIDIEDTISKIKSLLDIRVSDYK